MVDQLVSVDLLPSGLDPQSVEAASAAVRKYCQWHIAPVVSSTVTLDGYGARTILLPSIHVTAVTAVTVDGTAVDDMSTVEWSENGTLRLPCRSWKLRGITVEFTSGYTECPADVAAVVGSFAQQGIGPKDIQQQSSGPFSVVFRASAGGVAPAASTLDLYRLPPRP